jgi:hypothetical protein
MHRTANGSFEERPTSVQNAANGGKEPKPPNNVLIGT